MTKKEKKMKIDKKQIIDGFVMVAAAAGGVAVGTVVTLAISRNLPEATKMSQKIVQKVGSMIVGDFVGYKTTQWIQEEFESLNEMKENVAKIRRVKKSGPMPDLVEQDILFDFEDEKLMNEFCEAVDEFDGKVTIDDIASIFSEDEACDFFSVPKEFRDRYGWDSEKLKKELKVYKHGEVYACIAPPCVYFGKE